MAISRWPRAGVADGPASSSCGASSTGVVRQGGHGPVDPRPPRAEHERPPRPSSTRCQLVRLRRLRTRGAPHLPPHLRLAQDAHARQRRHRPRRARFQIRPLPPRTPTARGTARDFACASPARSLLWPLLPCWTVTPPPKRLPTFEELYRKNRAPSPQGITSRILVAGKLDDDVAARLAARAHPRPPTARRAPRDQLRSEIFKRRRLVDPSGVRGPLPGRPPRPCRTSPGLTIRRAPGGSPTTIRSASSPRGCAEVLSPTTASDDRTSSFTLYASTGVAHVWLLDPELRTIEVYESIDGRPTLVATARDADIVRALPPFDADFSLVNWWKVRPTPIAAATTAARLIYGHPDRPREAPATRARDFRGARFASARAYPVRETTRSRHEGHVTGTVRATSRLATDERRVTSRLPKRPPARGLPRMVVVASATSTRPRCRVARPSGRGATTGRQPTRSGASTTQTSNWRPAVTRRARAAPPPAYARDDELRRRTSGELVGGRPTR